MYLLLFSWVAITQGYKQSQLEPNHNKPRQCTNSVPNSREVECYHNLNLSEYSTGLVTTTVDFQSSILWRKWLKMCFHAIRMHMAENVLYYNYKKNVSNGRWRSFCSLDIRGLAHWFRLFLHNLFVDVSFEVSDLRSIQYNNRENGYDFYRPFIDRPGG